MWYFITIADHLMIRLLNTWWISTDYVFEPYWKQSMRLNNVHKEKTRHLRHRFGVQHSDFGRRSILLFQLLRGRGQIQHIICASILACYNYINIIYSCIVKFFGWCNHKESLRTLDVHTRKGSYRSRVSSELSQTIDIKSCI